MYQQSLEEKLIGILSLCLKKRNSFVKDSEKDNLVLNALNFPDEIVPYQLLLNISSFFLDYRNGRFKPKEIIDIFDLRRILYILETYANKIENNRSEGFYRTYSLLKEKLEALIQK